MTLKRSREAVDAIEPTPKRTKTDAPTHAPYATHIDRFSWLSDELLIRIFSYFTEPDTLLAVAPICRRFDRITHDNQLWRPMYHDRFVLPRAMRIPGYRDDVAAGRRTHKLHQPVRRRLWPKVPRDGNAQGMKWEAEPEHNDDRIDWVKQYKLRHNWAMGKCAVEELKLGSTNTVDVVDEGARVLVKVLDGIAITVDEDTGIRIWDLRSRKLLAASQRNPAGDAMAPTCVSVDDRQEAGVLVMAVGYSNGSFEQWQYDVARPCLSRTQAYSPSDDAKGIVEIAACGPYVAVAEEQGPISLHEVTSEHAPTGDGDKADCGKMRLITSLSSHGVGTLLVLSLRTLPTSTVASIAFTFWTMQGWSVSIQELHLARGSLGVSSVISSRIGYSDQVDTHHFASMSAPTPRAPPRKRRRNTDVLEVTTPAPASDDFFSVELHVQKSLPAARMQGPIALCYNHPYLLATLPDNTLILYLCTSTADKLSISAGIRLWGHTSGISDAEITSRGKAVSVSLTGEEMRVWELEGRPSAVGREKGNARSVQVRPENSNVPSKYSRHPMSISSCLVTPPRQLSPSWEGRRSWVGFDDEMVIVLKKARRGEESLLVYDFT